MSFRLSTLHFRSTLIKCVAVVLLLCEINTATSGTDTLKNLEGTWIIDAQATEEFVLSTSPPPNADKLAQWFGLASGYMALFTYEFRGRSLTASAFRSNKILEYQLVSEQGAEAKFRLKDAPDSRENTIVVSMLTGTNIKIVHSSAPEMNYLLWKRGQLRTESVTPNDAMAISMNWLASVQKIVGALRSLPNPSINTDAAR